MLVLVWWEIGKARSEALGYHLVFGTCELNWIGILDSVAALSCYATCMLWAVLSAWDGVNPSFAYLVCR